MQAEERHVGGAGVGVGVVVVEAGSACVVHLTATMTEASRQSLHQSLSRKKRRCRSHVIANPMVHPVAPELMLVGLRRNGKGASRLHTAGSNRKEAVAAPIAGKQSSQRMMMMWVVAEEVGSVLHRLLNNSRPKRQKTSMLVLVRVCNLPKPHEFPALPQHYIVPPGPSADRIP